MLKFLYYIKSTLLGLYRVISHLFKRAVTLEYPEKKPRLNERFRGLQVLKNCLACGKCKKVCPVDAIEIRKTETSFQYLIDIGKCIFCGNCQYYCPVHAIQMSNQYELAAYDRNSLIKEVRG